MKTITVQDDTVSVGQLCHEAQSEPILLLTTDGQEFILSQADRFEHEVEALSNSQRFQTFLDERMACQRRTPLEDIEREIDEELKREAG